MSYFEELEEEALARGRHAPFSPEKIARLQQQCQDIHAARYAVACMACGAPRSAHAGKRHFGVAPGCFGFQDENGRRVFDARRHPKGR